MQFVEPSVREVSAHAARLDRLAQLREHRCRLDAEEFELLAALAADAPSFSPSPELDKGYVVDDIACALRVPSVTAAAKVSDAETMTEQFPATLAAMASGRLDWRYARRLIDATCGLCPDGAALVEERVLRRAGEQTVAQFAASLRRAVARVDPELAARRRAVACRERRVVFTGRDDGMSELWWLLPAEQAVAVRDAIDHQSGTTAPTVDTPPDEPYSADQRRSDALLDLICSSAGPWCGACRTASRSCTEHAEKHGPAASTSRGYRPQIVVTVALSTLLGTDCQPVRVDGPTADTSAPIPAELARAIAADPTGSWRRLVTDEFGQVLDVGVTRYRPPAAIDHHVRARDVTCVFPGCRRTAKACELDHIVPWPDGPTSVENLHCLCSRHHHLKHEAGWQVHREPDGTTVWTNPTGHTYRQPPPDPPPIDTTMRQICARPVTDP